MGLSHPCLALTCGCCDHPPGGPSQASGPCLCLPRLMDIHFRDGIIRATRMGPGSPEPALPHCVTLGRSLPLSEPYTTVGTGQSTSEDSSVLLLGFPKPHPAHTPDSCVTVGQAASPWASDFLSMQCSYHPCSPGCELGVGAASWQRGG